MVNNASQLGVSMLPTDQAANLATLSSIYDTTGLKQRPATKEVVTEENVHYVTFLVSDGDNIAFNLWGNKDTWIMTCTVNSTRIYHFTFSVRFGFGCFTLVL